MATISKSNSKFLFVITVENARRAIALQDNLKDFFSKSKTKWSLADRASIEKMYTKFVTGYNIPRSTLKEFEITSAQALANLLYKSHDILEHEGWDLQKIKEFSQSKRIRSYNKWRTSDQFIEGRKLRRDDIDRDLTRIMVIYHRHFPGNPDTTFEYELTGITSDSDTITQVNMLKSDWSYQTGLSYFDANPILLENYLKKSDEDLKEVIFTPDFD